MRRLFVPPEAFEGDRIHITDKDDLFYLSVVLRMKVGDKLLIVAGPGEASEACTYGGGPGNAYEVCTYASGPGNANEACMPENGPGKVYEACITEIGRDGVWLDIVRELPACEGRGTRITLYQGLPKGAKMDEVVRKSTELGVSRIVPVVASRSAPGADGVSAAKVGRWRRIAEEAARQSRRIEIPEVPDPIGFEAAAAGLKGEGYDLVLVLFELEEGRTLKQALREGQGGVAERAREWAPKVAVFIGPEGGFENEEVDRIIQEGAISVTVGETILRTETAGPAAIAMILYEYEL